MTSGDENGARGRRQGQQERSKEKEVKKEKRRESGPTTDLRTPTRQGEIARAQNHLEHTSQNPPPPGPPLATVLLIGPPLRLTLIVYLAGFGPGVADPSVS